MLQNATQIHRAFRYRGNLWRIINTNYEYILSVLDGYDDFGYLNEDCGYYEPTYEAEYLILLSEKEES